MKKKRMNLDSALGLKWRGREVIQVRYNLGLMETGYGPAETLFPINNSTASWGPYSTHPIIDFRDDNTVWVWLNDDLCVEMSSNLIQAISDGFREQREEA